MFRKSFVIAAIAALMILPQAANAGDWQQEFKSKMERVEELTKKSLEEVGRALGAALDKLPRYGLPEVRPNGDIIIRRHHAPQTPAPGPRVEEPDVTETRV